MLGVLIEAQEEAIAVGEVLHTIRINRVESLHVLQNASNALGRIDGDDGTNGVARWWIKNVFVLKPHFGNPFFHLFWRDERETA